MIEWEQYWQTDNRFECREIFGRIADTMEADLARHRSDSDGHGDRAQV